jgi:methylphosphotriester-DNA--protein-cysteine methyltransferase
MVLHSEIPATLLRAKIRRKEICYAGNRRLKIYGTLQCVSGKRMKQENRIFFTSESEALHLGFRPCGHCMRARYRQWKHGSF